MKTICLNQEAISLPVSMATVGVFDGVHLGHQRLIRLVVAEARQRQLVPTVITFDRPPRQVLNPSFRPQLLTTLEEKQAILATLGVEQLVVLPFTRELAALTARDFMQTVLCGQLHVGVLVTGYDHRFGRNRAEGFDDYVRYGAEMGLTVMRGDAELMDNDGQAVSSSVIRQLLVEEGRVELMPQWLTRCYQLTGQVTAGEHIGHTLGFPTANLVPDNPDKLIPAAGAYAVWATVEGKTAPHPAMMNIGTRPTFDGKRQTLEVNLFDFDGNLYGKAVTVAFVARLREERRFDSPAALAAQLQEDRKKAGEYLKI